MPLILIAALLLVLTIGTMQYTRQGFGVCLSLNIFGMILIPYLCGIANHLVWGVWILRCIAVFDLIWCIRYGVQVLRKKSAFRFPVWEAAFLLFFLAVLWYAVRGRMYSDWDEFSFWGASLKFTVYQDVLYTSGLFENGFKSYPPAQILLQYGMMKTLGLSFREDVAIFAAQIPVIGVVMVPTCFFIQKKKYAASFAGAILLMLSPTILEVSAYTKTTVDLKLGVMIAFLVFAALFPQKRRVKIVLLCVGGSVLTLYKSTGFALAVLTLLFCCAYLLWKEKDAFASAGWKERIVRLLADFSPILAAAMANGSWRLHLAAQGVAERWQTKGSAGDLWDVLQGNQDGYRADVVQNFFNRFFAESSQGRFVCFAPFLWSILAAGIAAVAAKMIQKEYRKTVLYGAGVSIVVHLVFTASLLYSYLFVFQEMEAVGLASFYRYLNAGILAMLMVVFAMLLWAYVENGKPAAALVSCLCCLLVVANAPGFYGFCDILKAPEEAAAQTHHDRYLFIRTSRYIRQLGEHPRLYLITANDAGLTQMIVNYELLPDIVLPPQHTILSAQESDDPMIYTLSAEEWSKLLYRDFDYVYIHCPETQFVADYLSVFEDESQVVVDRMFEVIRHPDGTAKLRRIEMVEEDGYV